MVKEYRIQYKRGDTWVPSGVYTGTYTEDAAFAIMVKVASATISYRMVWGYAPSEVDMHDETPTSTVWVLSYTYVAQEDTVIGVFSSEEKAHIGQMFVNSEIGHNTLQISKHTIDKGKEG